MFDKNERKQEKSHIMGKKSSLYQEIISTLTKENTISWQGKCASLKVLIQTIDPKNTGKLNVFWDHIKLYLLQKKREHYKNKSIDCLDCLIKFTEIVLIKREVNAHEKMNILDMIHHTIIVIEHLTENKLDKILALLKQFSDAGNRTKRFKLINDYRQIERNKIRSKFKQQLQKIEEDEETPFPQQQIPLSEKIKFIKQMKQLNKKKIEALQKLWNGITSTYLFKIDGNEAKIISFLNRFLDKLLLSDSFSISKRENRHFILQYSTDQKEFDQLLKANELEELFDKMINQWIPAATEKARNHLRESTIFFPKNKTSEEKENLVDNNTSLSHQTQSP